MRNITVAASVRPPRLAVLVDRNDMKWQHSCQRIVEFLTRTWGGFGSILIPTDGTSIGAVFWKVLERFDPDLLYTYQRSGHDLEIEEPDQFERVYQSYVSQWEAQVGQESHPAVLDKIRDDLRKASGDCFFITNSLEQELKERLAPFYFENHVVETGAIRADYSPRSPLTDISDLLTQIRHSSQVLTVAKASSIIPPLWWASVFGLQSDELKKSFALQEVESVEVGSDTGELQRLFELAVTGSFGMHRSEGILSSTSQVVLSEPKASTPWAFSNLGLAGYRSLEYKDWEEPAVAVAGNTIDDFALYYALSRLRGRTAWLLPSISDPATSSLEHTKEHFLFCDALRDLERGGSAKGTGVALVSVSLSTSELEQVSGKLNACYPSKLSINTQIDAHALIPELPIRYFESNNAFRMRSVTVPDDGIIPLFETPIPKSFREVQPAKHRWVTELSLSKHRLPKHYALGWWMLGAKYFSTKDVRVSIEGPTYLCPSYFISAEHDIESSTHRPNIRIPEPLQIFQEISRTVELDVQLSDKGFYAEDTCRKLGGLTALASFLRSQEGQAFCRAFRDESRPQQNEHAKGVLLDQRRYIDFLAMNTAIGDPDRTRSLLDHLSRSGILYRGFVLQCEFCRNAEFFPLDRLTDQFECSRCHRKQIFTSRHWKYPDQPNLYYQLDEVVYQGLVNNMHVPLLALDVLGRKSKESFLYVPEIRFIPKGSSKPEIETDINCIVDSKLTLGEAKVNDQLESTDRKELQLLDSFGRLAKKLNAAQVVFATSSQHWNQRTVANVQACFKEGPITPIFLTHEHLFSE